MGNEDYWSEDFDTDQNCAERARIAELQEKVAQQVDPADWDLVDQGQTFYSLIVYWVFPTNFTFFSANEITLRGKKCTALFQTHY